MHSTGKFELMNRKTDEDEHSIEMQLSYVAKVMEARRGSFSVVPILVGSISGEKEKMYGQLLAKYFESAGTLFVISSDFCHWGERFQYTYHDESRGEIWRSIEDLDKQVIGWLFLVWVGMERVVWEGDWTNSFPAIREILTSDA